MPSFKYQDQSYPLVDKPTFGECEWVEKQAGQGFDAMGSMTKTAALVLLSLRRSQVLLTWADVRELSPADLVVEDGEPADPTRAEAPAEASPAT